MAGAMHKMAVYLGLVEDDRRYEDGFDSYEELPEYEDGLADDPGSGSANGSLLASDMSVGTRPAGTTVQATDLTRITTLHPRTYNEARTIGEHFRDLQPELGARDEQSPGG
jgi:cell division inhibitor SepF